MLHTLASKTRASSLHVFIACSFHKLNKMNAVQC